MLADEKTPRTPIEVCVSLVVSSEFVDISVVICDVSSQLDNCALKEDATYCWQATNAALQVTLAYGILLVAALPGWAIKQIVNLVQVCKHLELASHSYSYQRNGIAMGMIDQKVVACLWSNNLSWLLHLQIVMQP